MKTINCILVLLFILLITNIQLKPQHQIKSGVLANGGTSADNETNRVVGTIGQSVIGRNSNENQIMRAGFWEQASGFITDIREVRNNILPKEYYLYQNYPNPFNPSTTIKYSIPTSEFVSLKVYDLLGNEVVILVNEEKPNGVYEVEFSATGGSTSGGNAYNLSSGIYFYTLKAGKFSETKKLILMK